MAAVKQECAQSSPLERLISRSSPDGFGSSCDSISGLTGEVGTVTGIAKAVTMADMDLKEAAGVLGGQPASLWGIGQWGYVEDRGVYRMRAECFAPLAS